MSRTSLTNVRNYFKQYCNATSIHGFRYFGEERSTFEKVWWTVIFILCLCGCSFMIYKIYEKYETSPVIVTFATKETPLYKIPFPAVTICPEIKAEKRKFNLSGTFKKMRDNRTLTDTEKKYFQYMSLICDDSLFPEFTSDDTFSNEIFDALDKIRPWKKIILDCKIFGQECTDDMITPVFTDEGVCYSFNILDHSHIFKDLVYRHKDYHKVNSSAMGWSMERGYFNDSKLFVYPWRALFSGATNGLTLLLETQNEDIDYVCKGMQGYKVVLHSPVRIPRLKQEYFRVSLDEAVVAAVRPTMITTSEAVKNFNVDRRDCYFSSERNLKYFRSYSQQNCLLECLTNITLNLCECVNIYMPRDNDTKICGGGQRDCVKFAEEGLQLEELQSKFKEEVPNWLELADCDCLPLCSDLSYTVETSQTKWAWEERVKWAEPHNDSVHLSSLTVYFKVNHFITFERNELYGPTDFVANFGGLLGLFTGFSILSLMEIMYFVTVRICCNVRLYGRWTGEGN